MAAIPPPPPPPPPMDIRAPPPATGGRSDLLSSIQKGAKLKKTVTNDKSAPVVTASKGPAAPSGGGIGGGGVGGMLGMIGPGALPSRMKAAANASATSNIPSRASVRRTDSAGGSISRSQTPPIPNAQNNFGTSQRPSVPHINKQDSMTIPRKPQITNQSNLSRNNEIPPQIPNQIPPTRNLPPLPPTKNSQNIQPMRGPSAPPPVRPNAAPLPPPPRSSQVQNFSHPPSSFSSPPNLTRQSSQNSNTNNSIKTMDLNFETFEKRFTFKEELPIPGTYSNMKKVYPSEYAKSHKAPQSAPPPPPQKNAPRAPPPRPQY